jgi:hypothetical protein
LAELRECTADAGQTPSTDKPSLTTAGIVGIAVAGVVVVGAVAGVLIYVFVFKPAAPAPVSDAVVAAAPL